MRQIILDTETTGLDPAEGHRIIEIGCVELMDRRLTGNNFHCYLQPDREIDDGAIEVHGITNEFLADKPRFPEVSADFINYISGAELIIHNAPFDVGFLDNELKLARDPVAEVAQCAKITDTLIMARKLHPGQRNSLDALCKRYEIDNSHRELHGALLDAEILADVYLAMTGGQTSLVLGGAQDGADSDEVTGSVIRRMQLAADALTVVHASAEETARHQDCLAKIDKVSDGQCVWSKIQL